MNFDESIAWLYGTQTFGIKLGLENVTRLLTEEGLLPLPDGVRVVHVAGTNGKGSVCAFAERVLRDGEVRTGLFTSPHLVTYRERIRVDGEMIDPDSVARILCGLRAKVSSWETHPTFFEISLSLAMRYFRERRCEVIVLETGMGGRLDATNAVPSSVSVITPISLDHQAWLGSTIREIAAEKAGILKPGTPVVIADLDAEARDVVGRRALALGIPCIEAHPLPVEWKLGMKGAHQRENAALAVEAACRVAGDRLTRDGIRASLAIATWPGRFQTVDGRIVLDGAHNPGAAAALRETWEEVFPREKAHLLFSAVETKDVTAVLAELLPVVASVTFVPVRSERGLGTGKMREALADAGGREIPASEAESFAAGFESLADAGGRILVAGSLYLVGEALGYLQKEDFEVSLQ